MKKRKTPPVSKPRIPVEAENEIMDALSRDLRIGTDEIVAILKKHNVSGDTDALQDSYRKRVGQRLMASMRDEKGRRELLSVRKPEGNEYVVIQGCNNVRQLKKIRGRLQKGMSGISISVGKVESRIRFLERFRRPAGKGW